MNPNEGQRLPVRRGEARAKASSFGGVLISTLIMGFALVMITVFASLILLGKNLIK
jgi:hypothetical protein